MINNYNIIEFKGILYYGVKIKDIKGVVKRVELFSFIKIRMN